MCEMTDQNPFLAREVKSRRGGKVKEPLSRERIVEEALRLLTQDGLDGMSLRAVAVALETGPASLYAYVENLDALRALVLDRALAGVDTAANPRRGWKSRVKGVLESYVRVLLGTPGLAQLALSAIAVGPNSLRIFEELLDALDAAGLDAATAAWAVDLFLLYATAIGAEQSQRGPAKSLASPIAQALQAATAEAFPRVHAARAELLSGEGIERFEWAVDALIVGVLSHRRSPKRASAKKSRTRR
jgi:AcrR family transcriptional regulator